MRSIYEGLPRMAKTSGYLGVPSNTKTAKVGVKTRRTSGKKGERQSMFPPITKTPGKR